MNPKPESTRVTDPFVSLFQTSLERYARIRKETLDMIAQQSVETAEVWKKAFQVPANAPGIAGMDMAVRAVESFVEAEKKIVDALVEQSAISIDGTQEHGNATSRQMNAATEILQRSAERAVEVQKLALNLLAQQNKLIVEAVTQQPWVAAIAPAAAAAADSMQRGVDAVVEAQKDFLDNASQPLKAKAAKG